MGKVEVTDEPGMHGVVGGITRRISEDSKTLSHELESTDSMASKGEEMILWTRYFDSKLTRSQGRRVPKIASIPNPTLETMV